MEKGIYIKEPIRHIENIPVFSNVNSYIENYEKISSDHVEHFNRTGKNPFMEEGYWKSVEESTKSLIKKYAKPNDKILDVGVGMGRLLEDFNHLDRYGMDISKSYLKITSKKGINCCLALIDDMPYKEEIFDIVTCTDVLEHVLDLNSSISKILNLIKKGGILIVRVPYKEDIAWYLSEDCPYEFVHLRSFDEFGLKALFTKIFYTTILEWNTAGITYDNSRLKFPIPPYNPVLSKLYNLYYKWISKDKNKYSSFFIANEINFVIRK
jgi:ubiquinone/menaquinone biosynthesis C-methylase UbiE